MNLKDALIELVGHGHVLTGDAAAPYLTDWRGRFTGRALAVVRPSSTEQVAQMVRLCARARAPIVPQGGNTGLCGGATPDGSGQAVVLLTSRLNRVREIDLENDTMTVEAGCILQALQQEARSAGRIFPLSLAAEGSCTIGGNLATNAGGTAVLRYGSARELTLGVEVVGADGEVTHGLRGLRKDNTGYDLRDLYIGSEGTLGIITAATLKLFPQPSGLGTAFVAVPSLENAVTLLARARAGFGPSLTGFEVMARTGLDMVASVYPQQRLPFTGEAAASPWFALLEISDTEGEAHSRERLEAVLGAALEKQEATDVVVAGSIAQAKALWHLRESITLAHAEYGASIKHDVSIPISQIAKFVRQTDAALQENYPGVVNVVFGHLGDGNLHYNVGSSSRFGNERLMYCQDQIYELIHDAVVALDGSISAEHGIGQLKVAELHKYKSAQELRTMSLLKRALDPECILNPGKILPGY